MTRGWIVLLGIVAVVLVAVGVTAVVSGSDESPSGSDSDSKTTAPLLKVGLAVNVSNLDLTHNNEGYPVTTLGLEQLLQLTPDGKLKPWLAESVTHPDPVTYVYHLRKGVKFWDGSELTSADVVDSWNYERRPDAVSAIHFRSVKSIKADDKYTVRVTLSHPDAGWKYVPAEFLAQIFQKKFHDKHKQDMGKPGTLMVGTGPYKFDSLDPTRGAELSANPNYWGDKAPIERISIKFFSDENSMALAFRSGEIDAAPGIGQPQTFAATSGAKVQRGSSCAIGLFSMNVQKSPWDDVHVRRAVAYALNRPDIIEAYNGGYAQPITTLIPPVQLELLGSESTVKQLVDSLPSYPHSVDKAKEEMAKSEHPDGFSVTLPSLNGSGQNLAKPTQVIVEQLKPIGIDADIREVSLAEYIEMNSSGPDKRQALLVWSGCISPDPAFYTYALGTQNSESGSNYASYAPPEMDKLIADAAAEDDSTKRLSLYGEILRRLAIDVPYVPLFVNDGILAISGKFSWPTFDQMYYNRSWGLEIRPN